MSEWPRLYILDAILVDGGFVWHSSTSEPSLQEALLSIVAPDNLSGDF